jgi:hypothetical protein
MVEKTLDPRYRTNIEIGTRIMLKEENSDNSELIPCHVEEIISRDAIVENGVKVVCSHSIKTNGPSYTGRVKYIGTESSFMNSWELIMDLEKKLRNLIVAELSQDDLNWWENIVDEKIRDVVDKKKISGKLERQRLQIPDYPDVQELFFMNLQEIIVSKGPWKKYFEKIFEDKNSISVKLKELGPYRNIPAHGKEPTNHIVKKIQVYYDDINNLIELYAKKS